MNLLNSLKKVEKLHQLIYQEKTGTPTQLAKLLGMSRSKLYILMDELSALNMPVVYSRSRKTFYYEYVMKDVDGQRKKKIETSDEQKPINKKDFIASFSGKIFEKSKLSFSIHSDV